MTSQTKKSGYTIIELMLYISITTIIMFVLTITTSKLIELRERNIVAAEVEDQGVQVMQLITQTIRNASEINSVNEEELSLNTINLLQNPTIFGVENDSIYIKEGNNSEINLTSNNVIAMNFKFENLSKTDTLDLIRISFTLTYNNLSQRHEYEYSKNFYASAMLR